MRRQTNESVTTGYNVEALMMSYMMGFQFITLKLTDMGIFFLHINISVRKEF